MPPVPAEQIVLVTADSICERLSWARDSAYAADSEVAKQQALYAVWYDGYDAVNVPGDYAGEWRVIEFYDATTLALTDARLLW